VSDNPTYIACGHPADHHQSALASALIAHQEAQQPRRGDAVETWLKAQRDEYREQTDDWFHLDELLDQYRLHADTGTPLDQHVCERGTTDDCEGCHQASKGAKR
jgi:hypothetical protein